MATHLTNDHTQTFDPQEERARAQKDYDLFGVGFLIDGQRIDPRRVTVVKGPWTGRRVVYSPEKQPYPDRPCGHQPGPEPSDNMLAADFESLELRIIAASQGRINMEQTKPNQLVHLALAPDGLVVAQFLHGDDAAVFCADRGLTHLPFNRLNRDGDSEPAVGTVYRA